MAKGKVRLKLGPGGEIRLPAEALEALEIEPGAELDLDIDTRRKQLRLERHVADAWTEALKEKPQKGLEDLMSEQQAREEAAKELFEKRIKEPPAKKRRPEDNPDYWR